MAVIDCMKPLGIRLLLSNSWGIFQSAMGLCEFLCRFMYYERGLVGIDDLKGTGLA